MTSLTAQIAKFKALELLKIATGQEEAGHDRVARLRKLAETAPWGEIATELGGLGLLAAPSAYHFLHKKKPEDQESRFHRFMQSPHTEHAIELGGLGILASSYLKDIVHKLRAPKLV